MCWPAGPPRPVAGPVGRLLQRHDRGLVEAPAEVPRRGRVGQGGRPDAVQEHPVPPPQLDVVERPAAAERVVGDVEHVVGLVQGEQAERGVDLFGQAQGLYQLGDHAHAAVSHRSSALRQLVRRWPARAPGR